MNYTSLISLLRTTATTVNPDGFFLNAAGKNAVERESALSICCKEAYPQIAIFYLSGLPDYKIDSENYEVLITFYDQDSPGSAASIDDDQSRGVVKTTEQIVGEMYTLMDTYLTTLNETTQIANVKQGIEIKKLSNTQSGWSAIFKIETKKEC